MIWMLLGLLLAVWPSTASAVAITGGWLQWLDEDPRVVWDFQGVGLTTYGETRNGAGTDDTTGTHEEFPLHDFAATFDGITYGCSRGDLDCFGHVALTHPPACVHFVCPDRPDFGVVLTVPFHMTGRLTFPDGVTVPLVGQGTLRAERVRFDETFSTARYLFRFATPVPEPASGALLGLGLVALGVMRLRRRR